MESNSTASETNGEVSPAQRSATAPITPAHRAELRTVPVPNLLVSLLTKISVGPRNGVLKDAVPIPEPYALELNAVLDSSEVFVRIGPVISVHDDLLLPSTAFRLENFLGVDLDTRHVGPSLAIINVGSQPIDLQVVLPDILSLIRSGAYALTSDVRTSLLTNGHEIELGELSENPEIRTIRIEPKHALLLKSEMIFHRIITGGPALVMRGYFRHVG